MKTQLTDAEYNVLNRIARQTKMDCWFSLYTDEQGNDGVADTEDRLVYSLQLGISMLHDGIVPDLLNLTAEEIAVYNNLLNELGIKEELK